VVLLRNFCLFCLAVVDKIANVQTGAGDRPIEDVVIEKAEIV